MGGFDIGRELEFWSSEEGAFEEIDPRIVSLSIAISLKRIADALAPEEGDESQLLALLRNPAQAASG